MKNYKKDELVFTVIIWVISAVSGVILGASIAQIMLIAPIMGTFSVVSLTAKSWLNRQTFSKNILGFIVFVFGIVFGGSAWEAITAANAKEEQFLGFLSILPVMWGVYNIIIREDDSDKN